MSQTFIKADITSSEHVKRPKLLAPTEALDRLAKSVGRMHTSFADHIASEEGRCGFFAFLSTAAPRYLCMLDHLRADHVHLMQSIVSLRIRIGRADATQLDALLAETDAIQTAVEDHDAFEREMLVDALEAP